MYIFVFKVILPVFAIQIDENKYTRIVSPIEKSKIVSEDHDRFIFNELLNDYVDVEKADLRQDIPDKFFISIPKLGIVDAVIETNSTNLNPITSLGHYNGSCLPDEPCNTFIYGHSTYKYVKNRYDKGDYTAVFSKLNELNYGDEFTIKFNNFDYRYLVDTLVVDSPENIDPLKDPFGIGIHKSSVTLFTCDPPGTKKNRLLVVGVLID